MFWLVLALIGPFMQASVNLVDNYILTKRLAPFAPGITTGYVGILACLASIGGFCASLGHLPSPLVSLEIFLAGMATAVGAFGYYTALKRDKMLTIAFMQVWPIMVISWSTLWLHEPWGFLQSVGLSAMAVAILSIKKRGERAALRQVLPMALLADTCFATSTITARSALEHYTVLQLLGPFCAGVTVLVMLSLLEKQQRSEFYRSLKEGGPTTLVLVFCSEGTSILANVLLLTAAKLGVTSIVYGVGGVQYLYAVILALIFKIRERDDQPVPTRLALAGVIAVGAYLVSNP